MAQIVNRLSFAPDPGGADSFAGGFTAGMDRYREITAMEAEADRREEEYQRNLQIADLQLQKAQRQEDEARATHEFAAEWAQSNEEFFSDENAQALYSRLPVDQQEQYRNEWNAERAVTRKMEGFFKGLESLKALGSEDRAKQIAEAVKNGELTVEQGAKEAFTARKNMAEVSASVEHATRILQNMDNQLQVASNIRDDPAAAIEALSVKKLLEQEIAIRETNQELGPIPPSVMNRILGDFQTAMAFQNPGVQEEVLGRAEAMGSPGPDYLGRELEIAREQGTYVGDIPKPDDSEPQPMKSLAITNPAKLYEAMGRLRELARDIPDSSEEEFMRGVEAAALSLGVIATFDELMEGISNAGKPKKKSKKKKYDPAVMGGGMPKHMR